jgi:hypothetical protein
VPVDSPQLLQPGFTNGEIQVQAVDKAFVPVVAKSAHIVPPAGVEFAVVIISVHAKEQRPSPEIRHTADRLRLLPDADADYTQIIA